MSQNGPGLDKSFKTGADLNTTTADWRPVRINSSGSVSLANSITHRPIGILQNRPKTGTGAAAWVRSVGYSKITVNDTCTAGDLIVQGSTGAVRGTGLSITGNTITTVIGRAMEPSAISGTVVECLLNFYTIAGTLSADLD